VTGQLELWTPGREQEPCDTAPAPHPARWIHVSRVDPEEAALLDLYGEPVPRTTVTFHTPELCCDRAKYH
jgi:hypothetical protein